MNAHADFVHLLAVEALYRCRVEMYNFQGDRGPQGYPGEPGMPGPSGSPVS